MPAALAKTNKTGVPVVSTVLGAIIGTMALGPFKSWQALVGVVTGATAIMYGFAPIALATLHRIDPDRPRTYRVPAPRIVLPAAFVSANLIIYWGGFATTWKLVLAVVAGLALFSRGAFLRRTAAHLTLRNAAWIGPWLGGHVLIGWLGRYGGGMNVLPPWVDIAVVAVFSLIIYYDAIALGLSAADCAREVAKDARQLAPEGGAPPGAHIDPGAT